MATANFFLLQLLLLALVGSSLLIKGIVSQDDRKAFIVYMGNRLKNDVSASPQHINMLQKITGSDVPSKHLLHSYKRSFNGFAAMLTEEEVKKMAGLEGVVSVFPNRKKQLHTTKSWDFMGFSRHVERSKTEGDLIVGVLDSGIWPESESFSDQGLGPPPSKWTGTCQSSSNFTCNNKVIGAKYYRAIGKFGPSDLRSPRDSDGHGSHTASTVAGDEVSMANLYGLAQGTARGGVPSARVAAYKVCWSDGCHDADILAAFDDAIADGVDIISVSLGSPSPRDYFRDSIAIGAFHAMRKGILTSTSAGNGGPLLASITNYSPWSLSVAASTIDRKFFTKVLLGSGKSYEGISINTFDLKSDMYPIIYGANAPNVSAGYNGSISRYCFRGTLDSNLVKGKIVFCDTLQIRGPFFAGAVGAVMQDDGPKDAASSFPIPSSYLDPEAGKEIYSYMNTTSDPTATIFKSYEGPDKLAPYVVSFSSRGPNPATLDILKPDLAAPGVHILAAWSLVSPVSGVQGDNRFVPYNIISGTSMACPHASAIAAYIKSFHPTWSPAAIKSALMTTALPMSADINSEAEFAYGAGHIDPVQSLNPGLLYDADETDYVDFLCGQNYTTKTLQLVTGDSSSCSGLNNGTAAWDLNYPSFALSTLSKAFNRTFTRIVTNVGSPTSTYTSVVKAPTGIKVTVIPSVLTFSSVEQKLPFSVMVEGKLNNFMLSASVTWTDGVHQVRSPIVAFLVP
ncbi:cucumisin-like isoform X2 [Syzygium oleosum]|uniref:cucumisin-like isoform X2 n=1 Tax=Syzygium oleosum TaxID=219896 RepID=UPI0024BBA49D|nr:cucumisin-like isoform X2 [Syzygium oleosum]